MDFTSKLWPASSLASSPMRRLERLSPSKVAMPASRVESWTSASSRCLDRATPAAHYRPASAGACRASGWKVGSARPPSRECSPTASRRGSSSWRVLPARTVPHAIQQVSLLGCELLVSQDARSVQVCQLLQLVHRIGRGGVAATGGGGADEPECAPPDVMTALPATTSSAFEAFMFSAVDGVARSE